MFWVFENPQKSRESDAVDQWLRNFSPVECGESYKLVRSRAAEQFNHLWDATKVVEQKANWLFLASSGSAAWIMAHRSEFDGFWWILGVMVLPVISIFFSAIAFIPQEAAIDVFPKDHLDVLNDDNQVDIDAYTCATLHVAITGKALTLNYKAKAIRWSMICLAAGALIVVGRLAFVPTPKTPALPTSSLFTLFFA